MNKYRRTIVTLDDTKTGVDYMLFCVFEKLWPDMASPNPLHSHPKGRNFNKDGRFDICVHVDEIDTTDNIEDDPLPHIMLENKVEMLLGDMRRDPDPGVRGFMLKKDHYDIGMLTEMFPESQSVQEIWAWFDLQSKMRVFLEEKNIKLNKIGSFTQKHLGINLADNPLHIGCIYVIKYSPIKVVHIEAVPMIPAVRCELDWRSSAIREDVYVKVTEKVTDKQSIPNTFVEQVKKGNTFALIQMDSRPRLIDIDIENNAGEVLFFLRNVAFITSIVSSQSRLSQRKKENPLTEKNIGLEHYLRPAILEKEAADKRAKMEFVYFDGNPAKQAENKEAAIRCIKELLGKAKKELIIADPYFAVDQLNEYITTLNSDEKLEITIVNCKEQLESVAHCKNIPFQEMEDEMRTVVSNYNKTVNGNHISLYCITGKGRLHDRFILTENEGWQIGSSLSEFGTRACCVIKLFDSAHMELSTLIHSWCNDSNISYRIE